ncbi:hypothetical protein [Paraburkholderia sp. CI3]|uniref:hypothetical protein n=1 Tax=Paraburkholderia sp. CI3 TaxID=2991060 RepID=UPI003D238754
MNIRTGWWANPLAVRDRIRIVRTALHDPSLFSVSLTSLAFYANHLAEMVHLVL